MIHLNLADWIVGLAVEPPALAAQVAERYAPFACAHPSAPDLRITISLEAGGDPTQSLLQATVVAKGEEYLLDAPAFYGMIAPLRGQAELRMRSDVPAREVEYFLRVALALFAWGRGGLLAHGAAILQGDAAFLFIGQSGSGKSTLVSLSRDRQGAVALSDDLVLLRPAPRGWRAYGTPFWNQLTAMREGQTAAGPLKAIYKLIQDRDVYVEPMSGASAAAELLANCPIVNSQGALLPELMQRCRELAQAVATQKLHFRKDDRFWDVISC
jgi:hypothetical protein